MKKRFTEEQITGLLCAAEAGMPVAVGASCLQSLFRKTCQPQVLLVYCLLSEQVTVWIGKQ